MVLMNLNRSQDPQVSTFKLASITPRDWPTLPAPITAAMVLPIWVRTITYFGGVQGDDVTKARGWIGPQDPYAAPPASTLSGLSPNTAVHGTAAIPVTCTGTGFTP